VVVVKANAASIVAERIVRIGEVALGVVLAVQNVDRRPE